MQKKSDDMWNDCYDSKTDKTYECNLSVLPYIAIPKEQYELMNTMFEYEDIGKIQEAIYEYIYNDKEPNLATKPEMAFVKTTIDAITRVSLPYFKKLSTLKNQSGAVRIIGSNIDKKTIKKNANTVQNEEYCCPWTDEELSEDIFAFHTK